jgi:hypothetical protein
LRRLRWRGGRRWRAGDAGGPEDPADAHAAADDPLALGQELGEVAVVGAVVPTAGEGPDLLAGSLVDPARRRLTAIAMDQPSRTLVGEPTLEAPDRANREAEELGRFADLDLACHHLRHHPRSSLLDRRHRDRLPHGRRLTNSLISWH